MLLRVGFIGLWSWLVCPRPEEVRLSKAKRVYGGGVCDQDRCQAVAHGRGT